MSETNALNPVEQTSGEARPADAPTLSVTDTCGHRLFERLGVGGAFGGESLQPFLRGVTLLLESQLMPQVASIWERPANHSLIGSTTPVGQTHGRHFQPRHARYGDPRSPLHAIGERLAYLANW